MRFMVCVHREEFMYEVLLLAQLSEVLLIPYHLLMLVKDKLRFLLEIG